MAQLSNPFFVTLHALDGSVIWLKHRGAVDKGMQHYNML